MASEDPETMTFSTDQVLTVATGVIMCDPSALYDIARWLAGGPVLSHELADVFDQARPALLKSDGRLDRIHGERVYVTRENAETWRRTWIDRLGPTLTLKRHMES